MDNIILQSQKDAKKLSSHPRLLDTISWKGFIRYFLYRNSLPFVREMLFIGISLAEFFLVLYFFGKAVGVGSAIASVFLFFKNSFWRSFLFSLRDKILELKVAKNLKLIPNYFYSYTFLGIVYWLINIAAGYYLIQIGSPLGKMLFMHKLAAGLFALISSAYFISAYTLSRVYLSMTATIANRVLNLILVVVLYRFLGIYSFIISFYLVGIIDLLITIKYCKKIFVKNEVDFHIGLREISSSLTLFLKKTKEKHIQSFKKMSTFFLIYFQPLLVIYLVNIYYRDYLIEYFLFYSTLNLLFLIPTRISKSLYYDATTLIFKHNFNMLRNIFYKNMVVTLLLALCSVGALMWVVDVWTLPQKWSSLYLELLMIDQWKWLYIFIALSFPIRLIHYILLVGESFTFLTVLTLIFEYVLLAYLFLHGEYTDNILYIFFIKGQLSPYYLMALLGIFMSGIWKRDSGLAHILDAGPVSSNIVSKKQFMKKVDEVMHSDPIVNILMLDHKYIKTASIGSICSEIQTGFNPLAITRLSNNSIMVLNDVEQRDLEELDLAYKSRFGVFCMDILSTMISDFPSLIPRSKGHGGLNGSNFIMNQLYPKLRSNINDTIPDLDINSLDKLLSREGIKYRKMSVNMVGDFIETHTAGSKRSNEINELCMLLSKHDLILPDNIILKKDYLGLLPVMHNGELLFIYELENVDINKFRSILRSLLLNEVRGSCGV